MVYLTQLKLPGVLLWLVREIHELLCNGADPNVPRAADHGLTPVHFAARLVVRSVLDSSPLTFRFYVI